MMPSTSNLKQEERNWLDLPSDVTANILKRIGMVDILQNAQKVCTAWRKICKDPTMWRVINMNHLRRAIPEVSADKMCKHAVDRSQGQLVDITIVSTCDAELHLYVADRYVS
ncbi:putative F-box domain-containing protein [Helianthus annuus]|uniref:F-box domain-containing protein n=2 Tax=Helianthus annuus TaxID=4232 RepID=A0A9K3H9F9_HELAN|nr:putative F-box domain-containing protein [Helianthus annuus]KAJ0465642.1 putative F-box domain-containing protein [Helianthus annuus]KAJ0470512.1 putative F-box domain-containing protein [Helianthus annuus]KAJ0487235.1 putative F-box domain-containing protein [Helianthus annuus]KAJ0661349.1 putative F-box domain-containing protein [Helianthus annuus]